jgi:asparagine synthase (glutamine-hydrolysing)
MLSLGLNEAENRPHAGDLRSPLEARGLELRRWWSLLGALESGRASPLTHETQALEELERRLRDSIRLQSLADVPLGAFLSGGVDSSLIAALMQSESSSRIRTFTIGFREKQYNEAEHAAAVAKHLGTDHVELYVTANDALSVIERLPHLYDEPFSDSSQIPTFLLCAQARRYLTVALSGDAGDELFGGYNRYFWVRRIWDKLSWMPLSARRFFGRALSAVPADRWDKAYACVRPLFHPSRQVSLLGDKVHRLAERLDTVTDDDALFYTLVSEWKRPLEIAVGASEPDTLLTRRSEWPILEEVEDRMMYLDAMTYLPDDILVKVDRAAMGTSLETRVPMLDHRVVETAWRLPLGMKIRNGQGKWALRQILYKYVPRELIERPKQGFGIPLGAWLRGPLRDWAEDLLAERRLIEDGFLNPVPVRLKWREHLSGSRNWEHALWSVLMFQAWRSATK